MYTLREFENKVCILHFLWFICNYLIWSTPKRKWTSEKIIFFWKHPDHSRFLTCAFTYITLAARGSQHCHKKKNPENGKPRLVLVLETRPLSAQNYMPSKYHGNQTKFHQVHYLHLQKKGISIIFCSLKKNVQLAKGDNLKCFLRMIEICQPERLKNTYQW